MKTKERVDVAAARKILEHDHFGLEKVKERAVGSVAKGISCLEMSVQGYTSVEIGKYMHAEAATVRMWMTSARRFLKEQPEIKSCMEEGSV